jgi:hypothetical protein
LSGGEIFWIDASLNDAAELLDGGAGMVAVGGRFVNPLQVAQLTYEQVPSIESPERLKEVA